MECKTIRGSAHVAAWVMVKDGDHWHRLPEVKAELHPIQQLAKQGIVTITGNMYRRNPDVKVMAPAPFIDQLRAGPICTADWQAIGAASRKSLHVSIGKLRKKGHKISTTQHPSRRHSCGRPASVYSLEPEK